MQQEKTYSADEAAKYLNISGDTVRRYIKDGMIKASKLGGAKVKSHRHWRIKESDLKLFLERSESNGTGS